MSAPSASGFSVSYPIRSQYSRNLQQPGSNMGGKTRNIAFQHVRSNVTKQVAHFVAHLTVALDIK